MPKIQSFDDIKAVFVDERDEVLGLRQKHFNEIESKSYPKIGKINLNQFAFDQFDISYQEEDQMEQLNSELKQFVEDEENVVVLKDGNIVFTNLSDSFDDVIITTYRDALIANNQEVLNVFTKSLSKETENKFISVNKAFRNSSLLIFVPKNVVVKETLKVHLIATKDLVHYTQIIASQSSELVLLEKIDNVNAVNANIFSETFVMENAKLNYIGIDRLCETSLAFIERRADVYNDGQLIYALGQLNDGNTVSNNLVKLLGKNAQCESRNVFLADRESTHAITIQIEHLAPYSVGNIINHGIVKDKGYLHIDGVGKIHQGMKQSNAQQSTQVITLSDEAKVDANPYLLIDEYDVMAGHGAGVGRIDDEQLYYLMSRGLSKREAEKLIILGFLYPIIELIDSDVIKESFVQTIERKLSI